MPFLRFTLFVVASTLFAITAIAQPTLRGTVVDGETGQPIPGAGVFISGTTIGTSTDSNGKYSFRLPRGHVQVEVTAQMVGFVTQTTTVTIQGSGTYVLDFQLQERLYRLGEVTVTASNQEWFDNLERFRKRVFSTTENSSLCSIDSPERLNIHYDASAQVLTASSPDPFQFTNEALGYRVTIYDFWFEGMRHRYNWKGQLRFEELDEVNQNISSSREVQRKKAFVGSTRHFLRSVLQDSVQSEGFLIARVAKPGNVFDRRQAENPQEILGVIPLDSAGTYRAVAFQGILAVSYFNEPEAMAYRWYQDELGIRSREEAELMGRLIPRQQQHSWLQLFGGSVIVDEYGNQFGAYPMERYGYWEWERLCDLLPTNYLPRE